MSHSGGREPSVSLSLLDATMVGIGAMIGAGIFVLTGLAVDISGPAALVAFALNGGVTTFTALSYAELASAIPRNGGGYAYVREVFSAPVAFVMGWTRWFTYMIAGSLYALGFASNFLEWGHIYGITLPGQPVLYALGAVVALVALNGLSTEASGRGETVITIVKIAILAVFVVFGLTATRVNEFDPLFTKGPLSLLPAMGLTFIAFQGYDLIATVTEEVENPQVNIPRAILLSVLVTVVVYLFVVFVAIGTLGAEELAGAGETAIAQAAEGFMPSFPIIGTGASLIAFGAVFSTISALNAVVIGSSRVAFAMGRERQLPARLGRFHHRYGTPLVAIMASAVVMLIAVVVVPIRIVGNLASLFSLLGFIIVNYALIRLRRRQPDLQRPFEVPFYPVTPILGIVCNALLGLFIDPFTWILAIGWLLFGGVVYLALSRRGDIGPSGPPEIQEPEPIQTTDTDD
ncbi:amino acid permease [Haloferax sp. MBLA0076]|uniref:Amino acid permease n=1 Tax=Haloferax litoreum TaxID=2666140 RepID=A0A6A8GKC7_9EURY|nr:MULTISPECIES: APC family permease [Haloferax]KAB1194728.1 amino acid permease [Haloferax sp. CBA1148]MRX23309.1 amino acid permease [Haloferax litoreum]